MKVFGLLIVRTRAAHVFIQQSYLDRIHQRNRALDADVKSLTSTVAALEEKIEAYKEKTSRVNLSKLENELFHYRRKYPDEKILLDNELRSDNGSDAGVLPQPLVQAADKAALGDTAIVLEPQPE